MNGKITRGDSVEEMQVVVEEDSEQSGQELLFEAAATGKVSQLKDLLARREELGIDLNGRNDEGFTALQVAVSEGYAGG